MDPNYFPREQANEMKRGESILEEYSDNDGDTPIEIAESLKETANPYAVSEALETAIPGISHSRP